MDNRRIDPHEYGDNYEEERRAEIEWEWENPTTEELREELLQPWKAVAEGDGPFTSVARAALNDDGPDTHRVLWRVSEEWPDSPLAQVEELHRPTTERGRRGQLRQLAAAYPNPLRPGRWKELASGGYDPDLSERDRWEIVYEAARSTRSTLREKALADLPDSLHRDLPLRNKLNEVATEVVAGSRERRDRELVPHDTGPEVEGSPDTETWLEVDRRLLDSFTSRDPMTALGDDLRLLYRNSLTDDERELVEVMRKTGPNVSAASEELGWTYYKTRQTWISVQEKAEAA